VLDWECVQPLLDEAISSLDDEDRDALLLRFFRTKISALSVWHWA